MKHHIILLMLIIFLPVSGVLAQNQNGIEAQITYNSAENLYEAGRFDEAEKYLLLLKDNSNMILRTGAFRLLTLCALEKGDTKTASSYVDQLLKNDPYYTPSVNDPQRFVDMIVSLKSTGRQTITTASLQAETIEESPVPVTLITEDMLRDIGARTVKDALLAYVPGMTDIASNEEMNIAMRGVYSTSQSKILVLQDGHRLNSYSTNAAAIDHSISLDKVKQIEVLRGPASSIYGGVALTAVVNIITKEGKDIDGVRIKGGLGNYGQAQGSVVFGKRYMNFDVLAWASIYNSTGQKYWEEGHHEAQPYAITAVDGNVIIGGYNGLPSFDVGTKLSVNNWHFMYNLSNSKSVSPKSLSIFFAPYAYDQYRRINGRKPGISNLSHHGEIGYSINKDKWSWSVTTFFDAMNQQRYQIGGDTIDIYFPDIAIIPYFSDIAVPYMHGAFQSVDWNEWTMGIHARSGYNYNLGRHHKGSLMFGAHASNFYLYDSKYVEGVDFTRIVKTYDDIKTLTTGSEILADGYLQIKHSWKDIWIFNGGIRYDYKQRNTNTEINEWSPRLALIFNQPKYDIKFSVSKSFVDAPYFYRNNSFDIDCGNDDLTPEKMTSMQLSFYSANGIANGLTVDANVFFNNATDVITKFGEYAYNAGKLSMLGGELALRYKYRALTAETNFTYQNVIDVNDYSILQGNVVSNIPDFKFNAILSYEILKGLNIHTSVNTISKQTSYVLNPLNQEFHQFEIPSYTILNLGANYAYKDLQLSLNVNNLLNKKYELGGSSYAPLPQQGLWLMGSVAYKF